MINRTNHNRVVYFDYLRVAAVIAVIVLHVAAQYWYDIGGASLEWQIFNFYDGIVRWGVPIFVMISGALFLSREVSIEMLYKKYISRMLVAYFFWVLFYAIIEQMAAAPSQRQSLSIINLFIDRKYHLWFIPMIIGLYMCLPIIKELVKSKTAVRHYLILSFIFAFFIPQLVNISNDYIGGEFAKSLNQLNEVVFGKMQMHLVLGYPFYFILGNQLNKLELTKKQRLFVYILGMIGFFGTVVLNAVVAYRTDMPCKVYYNNFSINVLLEAVAVHTWFKYRNYNSDRINTFAALLGKYSFGVYLVHIFVIEKLQTFGIDTFMYHPFVSVPIISIIAIIISFAISFLLHQIPRIHKWIV